MPVNTPGKDEEKMQITKFKNDKIYDQYNIYNVDTIEEMGRIVHNRHNTNNALVCEVYWGAFKVGGKGHKLTLKYNNDTVITID